MGVLASLGLLVSCAGNDDSAPDAGAPSTDDTAAIDTGELEWGDTGGDVQADPMATSTYSGTAEVMQGLSWSGTELLQLNDAETGALLCGVRWTATSTTPLASCTDCDFAFRVTLSDPTVESGDCLVDEDSFVVVRGYAALWWHEAIDGTVSDALIVANDDDWHALSYTQDAVSYNSLEGGTLTYSTPALSF